MASLITRRWVDAWSARYPSQDEPIADLEGKRRPSFDDVTKAVRWKSARSTGYFARNDRTEVEAAVRRALAEKDPEVAMAVLLPLQGVQARMASAILTAFDRDRYTVMDVLAWRTLRAFGRLAEAESLSWRAAWPLYLAECERIAKGVGVDLRTLDRALWAADGETNLP